MRRTAVVLAPLAALCTLFACEDASVIGQPDPFVPPDAANLDVVAPDVYTPPERETGTSLPPLAVTVVVTNRGKFVSDRLVVFHGADGAVLSSAKTDVDGRATSTGAVPAMASVLLGTEKSYKREIITWTAVEAGDVLFASDVSDDETGSFGVVFPGAAEGASSYSASAGGCTGFTGDPSQVLTLYVDPGCLGPTQSAVLGRATGDGAVVAYAFKRNAGFPPADGGSAAVTLGPWVTPENVTMTFANAPQGDVSIDQRLFEIANGAWFHNEERTFAGEGVEFKVAPGFADARQGLVRVGLGAAGASTVIARRAAPTATMALDFAGALAPFADATLETTNLVRPEVSWTFASALGNADGGAVQIHWWRPSDDTAFVWSFVVPPNATRVKAPAMPAEAAGWLPDDEAGAPFFEEPELAFAHSDLLAGYNQFRAAQGLLLTGKHVTRDDAIVLPANGNLKATVFQKLFPR
jgi:hypothetical protein